MCSVISEMCKLLFPPYITLSNDTIGFLLFHSVFLGGGCFLLVLLCFVFWKQESYLSQAGLKLSS